MFFFLFCLPSLSWLANIQVTKDADNVVLRILSHLRSLHSWVQHFSLNPRPSRLTLWPPPPTTTTYSASINSGQQHNQKHSGFDALGQQLLLDSLIAIFHLTTVQRIARNIYISTRADICSFEALNDGIFTSWRCLTSWIYCLDSNNKSLTNLLVPVDSETPCAGPSLTLSLASSLHRHPFYLPMLQRTPSKPLSDVSLRSSIFQSSGSEIIGHILECSSRLHCLRRSSLVLQGHSWPQPLVG